MPRTADRDSRNTLGTNCRSEVISVTLATSMARSGLAHGHAYICLRQSFGVVYTVAYHGYHRSVLAEALNKSSFLCGKNSAGIMPYTHLAGNHTCSIYIIAR